MPAQNHPAFQPPKNPEAVISRYMSFAQFVAMLQQDALFFSRLSKCRDHFEGSLPVANWSKRQVLEQEGGNAKWISEPFQEEVKQLREYLCVSCWHESPHESAAMWELYGSGKEIVCVKTTFSKLKRLLPETIAIGCVQYIDFDNYKPPIDDPLCAMLLKRKSFEHEKEVRAINIPECVLKRLDKPHEAGVWQPIDISQLIDSVSVAPEAGQWFNAVVHITVVKYGHRFPVEPSTLESMPYW
jgi:hypothetical protein